MLRQDLVGAIIPLANHVRPGADFELRKLTRTEHNVFQETSGCSYRSRSHAESSTRRAGCDVSGPVWAPGSNFLLVKETLGSILSSSIYVHSH